MRMRWMLLPVIALAAVGIVMTGCDLLNPTDEGTGGSISWTAVADGAADTTTTTKITLTFDKDPGSLTAGDITITAGTGAATKGDLTGSGTSRSLAVSAVTQGTVKIKISKSGVSTLEHTITVNKQADPDDITWKVTTDGTGTATSGTKTSTVLTFEFSEAVTGLTPAMIKIDPAEGDDAGDIAAYPSATLGNPFENVWVLPISVTKAGKLSVKIEKAGITDNVKEMTVYVLGKEAGEDAFTPVASIALVSPAGSTGAMNTDIYLTGTVTPVHATNQTITWAVKTGEGFLTASEAKITGNILRASPTDVDEEGAVLVTATITNGTAVGTSYTRDFAIMITKTGDTKPALTGTPTITGTVEVGTELTANTTGLSGSGAFEYIWMLAETSGAFSGEPVNADLESNKYTPVAADVGKFLSVAVTRAGSSGYVISAAHKVLVAGGSTANNVTFSGLALELPVTGAATGVKLTFDKEITELAVGDITVSGISSVTKGELTGPVTSGSNKVYTLKLTAGITTTTTGTLTVKVAKTGFTITPSAGLTVAVSNGRDFTPVTNITGVPTIGYVGVEVTLTGTAEPAGATNKTPITWSVTTAGAGVSTGALTTGKFTPTSAGTVKVTASIANGLTVSTAFTKEFTITIPAKTVSVGTQDGDMEDGVGGSVEFTVTTTGIADGEYAVTVENLPDGVTVENTDSKLTITSGSGTLILEGDEDVEVGIYDDLILTIVDTESEPFTLTIDS